MRINLIVILVVSVIALHFENTLKGAHQWGFGVVVGFVLIISGIIYILLESALRS